MVFRIRNKIQISTHKDKTTTRYKIIKAQISINISKIHLIFKIIIIIKSNLITNKNCNLVNLINQIAQINLDSFNKINQVVLTIIISILIIILILIIISIAIVIISIPTILSIAIIISTQTITNQIILEIQVLAIRIHKIIKVN